MPKPNFAQKNRGTDGSFLSRFQLGAQKNKPSFALLILFSYLLALAIFIVSYFYFNGYFASFLAFVSVCFIFMTIVIQVGRYRRERIKQNLYPLIGYIFIFVYALALALYRLPSLDMVFLRRFTFQYNQIWLLMLAASFLGFLFLAIWAWNFIKVREFLRTYVLFLSVTIFISSLGSLLFTLLIFNIVEQNNLKLMSQGAKTQQLILNERSDTAMFITRTISSDPFVQEQIIKNNTDEMEKTAAWYYEEGDLDALYIYNKYGEIIVSPGEPKDVGRMMDEDSLVAYAITENNQAKSFDFQQGILTPVIVTRAVSPILKDGEVIGAVEARHVFDNAFVDFSKGRTGLDTTIFTGDQRSATTIWTDDGVSRWVGSHLNDPEIADSVLMGGQSQQAIVNRLGRTYYNAYEPIRNVNGDIIGMVVVGVPADILLEDTRQELLTTFLALAVISSLIALLGYYTVHTFYTKRA